MGIRNRLFEAASLIVLAACAGGPTTDEQLALEYARAERIASIQDFVLACEKSGRTIVYLGPSYHKLRDPVRRPPSHARLSDYSCQSNEQVSRDIGVGG